MALDLITSRCLLHSGYKILNLDKLRGRAKGTLEDRPLGTLVADD